MCVCVGGSHQQSPAHHFSAFWLEWECRAPGPSAGMATARNLGKRQVRASDTWPRGQVRVRLGWEQRWAASGGQLVLQAEVRKETPNWEGGAPGLEESTECWGWPETASKSLLGTRTGALAVLKNPVRSQSCLALTAIGASPHNQLSSVAWLIPYLYLIGKSQGDTPHPP